jgi:hypothetical protein
VAEGERVGGVDESGRGNRGGEGSLSLPRRCQRGGRGRPLPCSDAVGGTGEVGAGAGRPVGCGLRPRAARGVVFFLFVLLFFSFYSFSFLLFFNIN